MKLLSRCVRWSCTHRSHSELQQAEIFPRHLSKFGEGYVRTSVAATRHIYLLQQELYFKETSSSSTWRGKALSREIWPRLSPSWGKNFAQKCRYHLVAETLQWQCCHQRISRPVFYLKISHMSKSSLSFKFARPVPIFLYLNYLLHIVVKHFSLFWTSGSKVRLLNFHQIVVQQEAALLRATTYAGGIVVNNPD